MKFEFVKAINLAVMHCQLVVSIFHYTELGLIYETRYESDP
mgnify:CR=1 FL=1